MTQYNWINEDSFGDNLPANWRTIVFTANLRLESLGIPEECDPEELTDTQRELIELIWRVATK